MEQSPMRRPGKRWYDDSSLIKVPVIVCATSGTYAGNTYHIGDQRLLDALNAGFVAKALRMGKEFMPLTEVEAFLPTGKRSAIPCIYVRKSNIYFVGEKKASQSGPAAPPETRRGAHLVRKKTQAGTEIHMPPYLLQGNVHIDIWEEFLDTIDRDLRFMPLTDVKVRPALPGGASAFEFVAVNKDLIAYIAEAAAPPQ